ncbi:MAG: pyridoxamine 5'-phosphate oxidase [Pseudomonadota bacterium]
MPLTEQASDPIQLFADWYARAGRSGIDKPDAMALATSGPEGHADCRMVLLSSFDAHGFVFHTNYQSRKGDELAARAWAMLLFWWDPLGYQVRIEGPVEKTSAAESDVYFAGRPRGSQLGAWASAQSRAIGGRADLERALAAREAEFAGRPVPRPPHWGGYRVIPMSLEFWENRDDRLHDRLRYERLDGGTGWSVERLAP